MADKNCLVVKLRATVSDGALEPIVNDDLIVFTMLGYIPINPTTGEPRNYSAFNTRALGPISIQVLDDVTLGIPVENQLTGIEIIEGKTYRALANTNIYGGFTVAEQNTRVRVCVNKDEMPNLGYIYSTDIDLDYIGSNVVHLQLSNISDPLEGYRYHSPFNLADLNLADKVALTQLSIIGLDSPDVSGTLITGGDIATDIASCPSMDLTNIYASNNRLITGNIASLGKFPRLKNIDFAYSAVSGSIEEFVRNLVNARELQGLNAEESEGISIGFALGNATFNNQIVRTNTGLTDDPSVENMSTPKTLKWTINGNTINITMTCLRINLDNPAERIPVNYTSSITKL